MFNDEHKPLLYPKKSHPNKAFIDLTGKRFGRLTVIEKNHVGSHRTIFWKCKCDCGEFAIVRGKSLKSGNTKSCGCLIRDRKNVKHGYRHTRLYNIWSGIKARCYNQSSHAYKRYGERGISMCLEWLNNFESFYMWSINNGYSESLSIDRIDVNGNYDPSNCRWATSSQQSNNKRNNILITLNGVTLNLQKWCNQLHIKRSTVNTRVRVCGWTYEKALTTPVRQHKKESTLS